VVKGQLGSGMDPSISARGARAGGASGAMGARARRLAFTAGPYSILATDAR